MKFSVFQVSRKGGRQINEDRMGYCYTRSSAIFLLADGMGDIRKGRSLPSWPFKLFPLCFNAKHSRSWPMWPHFWSLRRLPPTDKSCATPLKEECLICPAPPWWWR